MTNHERGWTVHILSMVFLLGIFAITSLFLANVGMETYKNIVLANNDNFQLRTSLSYVATKIRQSDTKNRTYIEEKEGAKVLVLGEEIDGENFETLIYYKDGYLCELYREEGMEYDLGYGVEMIEIHDFQIDETEDGQIHLIAQNKTGDRQELMLTLRTRR